MRPGERAGGRALRTMYTITKGPSKLVAQRRTGARGAGRAGPGGGSAQ